MKIVLHYNYTTDIIPKGCRKPRPTVLADKITLTIREVSGSDAPVAIREIGGQNTVYRLFRGKLYARRGHQPYSRAAQVFQSSQDFAADPYPFGPDANIHYDSYQGKLANRKKRMNWAAGVLLIDGERWDRVGEPRYVVMTFGLGGNHGLGYGTDLTTSESYNSNLSRNAYFRVDQFEAAVAETTRVATARGDTKALPVIERQQPTRYEVLIPAALKLHPRRQHGTGDAFLASAERLIQDVKNPSLAAPLLMLTALRAP